MTSPRIITANELALRAQAETSPHTTLRTHAPRHYDEIGTLPPRLSTFRPPLPSLGGLTRDGSAPSHPAGRGDHEGPRHRPGLSAPEGVVHFHPSSPRDAEAFRRMTRDLLRVRPDSEPRTSGATAEPVAAPAAARPSLADCRRDLSEFRTAMAEFTNARYFGGEDRHAVASAALRRAEAAYANLYANLPLTPSMSSILESFDGRLASSRTELASMAPRTGHSRRHA